MPECQHLTPFAAELGGPEFYDLMAAIRGPDHITGLGRYCKKIATARLRVIAFAEPDLIGGDTAHSVLTRRQLDDFLDYCDSSITNSSLWQDLVHVRTHLADAIHATREHPIWAHQRRADALYLALRGDLEAARTTNAEAEQALEALEERLGQ